MPGRGWPGPPRTVGLNKGRGRQVLLLDLAGLGGLVAQDQVDLQSTKASIVQDTLERMQLIIG